MAVQDRGEHRVGAAQCPPQVIAVERQAVDRFPELDLRGAEVLTERRVCARCALPQRQSARTDQAAGSPAGPSHYVHEALVFRTFWITYAVDWCAVTQSIEW
ncbi:hypothetical protein ABIA33_007595 [Streptacidiphilus sp. MAP12-16]|uniref:hypothetical protein n=1 Tax=Streptacidiphilus sp. MAP12-16 TaxID=3156300 RepID=UPI003512C8D5